MLVPCISETSLYRCGPGELSRYSDLLRSGRSGDRTKARVCGRSLTRVAGSNPAGGMGICVVCCTVKDKRQSHNSQNKEVKIKYREQKKIPVGARFSAPVQTGPGPHPVFYKNSYRVSFPGLSCRGVALTATPASAEVKERVELYLYSPSGPSWPVVG